MVGRGHSGVSGGSGRGVTIGTIFSGSILSNERFFRRLPIIGFGCLLMLFYMAIGFTVQRRHNYLDQLGEKITELRTISITTSAVRQQLTRQSNIELIMERHGISLHVSSTPPRIISLPADLL